MRPSWYDRYISTHLLTSHVVVVLRSVLALSLTLKIYPLIMAGPSWNYALKFIITGERCPSPQPLLSSHTGLTGDAGVGKSSLLVRLTDQRFLAIPDPTVHILSIQILCSCYPCIHVHKNNKLGVAFGSKLIAIPEEDNKVVKLQCA